MLHAYDEGNLLHVYDEGNFERAPAPACTCRRFTNLVESCVTSGVPFMPLHFFPGSIHIYLFLLWTDWIPVGEWPVISPLHLSCMHAVRVYGTAYACAAQHSNCIRLHEQLSLLTCWGFNSVLITDACSKSCPSNINTVLQQALATFECSSGLGDDAHVCCMVSLAIAVIE